MNEHKTKRFLKLRFGLTKHIKTGQMSFDMYGLYVFIMQIADYNTGILQGTSAPYLAVQVKKPVRWVQQQLVKLEKNGYIKRFGHRGQVKSYSILIDKFKIKGVNLNGTQSGIDVSTQMELTSYLIDARKTMSLNKLVVDVEFKGNLTGTQTELTLNLNGTYFVPYIDVIDVIDVKSVDSKTNPPIPPKGNVDVPKPKKPEQPSWRTDLVVYRTELEIVANEILKDPEEEARFKKYHPKHNFYLSLNKAIDYWASESTWEDVRRKRKGKTVRMKEWITRNMDKNLIY